jgi:ABC-type sugar transport system ATPase subunit
MTSLTLRDIEKIYPNGTRALKGINLDIRDGEFMVFVGPSGCGKSTLLRMVAGLETVTAGEMLLDAQDLTKLSPADRDVAMVFQNYALYPHMNVKSNISYALKNRNVPSDEIDLRVAQASEMLNISEYLDRKPSQLSGGQKQRVAMGRAIVRKPKIFLSSTARCLKSCSRRRDSMGRGPISFLSIY